MNQRRPLALDWTDSRLSLTDPATGFQLAFTLEGERWIHRLAATGESPRALVESLEADIDHQVADRIVTPSFQDIHHENRAGVDRVFLIGQFGRHHFGAVFEVLADGDSVTVAADVTDRCPHAVTSLASTYRVLSEAEPTHCDDGRMTWRSSAPNIRLELSVDPPNQLAAQAPTAAGRPMCVQALAHPADGPTYRWRYRWTWTKPAETSHDG